jgi:hypothetical protein
MTVCNQGEEYIINRGKFNFYDTRKECEASAYRVCYDWSLIDKFLNRADVKKELGVPDNATWDLANKYI